MSPERSSASSVVDEVSVVCDSPEVINVFPQSGDEAVPIAGSIPATIRSSARPLGLRKKKLKRETKSTRAAKGMHKLEVVIE